MEIYIQSAGSSPDNDYCWVFEDNSQVTYKKEPPISTQAIPDLISQDFSLVLGRRNKPDNKPDKRLFLYISGLKSESNRKDFQGRQIRNSVVWLSEPNNEEESKKIFALTVKALNNKEKLANEIEQAITAGGQFGFDVDWKIIKNIKGDDVINLDSYNQSKDNTKYKIGSNTNNFRNEIAKDLKQNLLINKNKIELLVIISHFKSESSLKQTGVWRGLSDLIIEEKYEEYDPKKSQKNNQSNKPRYFLNRIRSSIKKILAKLLKITPLI